MRAVIIANGDVDDHQHLKELIKTDDLIICADGAIRHCIKMNITPDYWIGDFDSCAFDTYIDEYPFLRDINIVRLNPEKDITDTHAACDIALDLGYNEILIIAAIGTRFDHSLSNVHLLEYLFKAGVSASICNERNTIRIFGDSITINRDKKYLSLIPLDTGVKIVKTTGLKYSIENHELRRYVSLGVSNEIISDNATVIIEGGLVLAIESND